MEKNQEFTVSIEDISEDGAGIGKLDGYIWFIKDAVIGDVVRARAMKMKKNYGFARLMEILTSSEARVEPKCPVARQCGGCQIQAMAFSSSIVSVGCPSMKYSFTFCQPPSKACPAPSRMISSVSPLLITSRRR